MNLDEDLQRVLNVGAKVYDTSSQKQGRVVKSDLTTVQVDYGDRIRRDLVDYPYEEFCALLVSDSIVANYRLTLGVSNGFKINPRQNTTSTAATHTVPVPPLVPPLGITVQDLNKVNPSLEIGYINFSTGRFSTEPKKGYTKIEYKKSVEKVTIEVDSEMLDKLRDMGIIK